MAAKIPLATQQRITELARRGWRIKAIASEVEIERHTVARYVAKIGRARAVRATPGAELTVEDLAWVQGRGGGAAIAERLTRLVDNLRSVLGRVWCPKCHAWVTVLRSQTQAGCRSCSTIVSVAAISDWEAPAAAGPGTASMGAARVAPSDPRPRR